MNGKINLLEQTEHGGVISKDFFEGIPEITVNQSQTKREDQETRLKMVKLKEYFGRNWRRNYLTRKDEIMKLLDELEIKNYEFIRIASRMLIKDDRCVVIVIAKRTDNGHLRKIVIDTKLGNPTWQQFIDVTYNIGADSEVKIIVFDDGYLELDGKSDSPGDDLTISDLVIRNNRCGVDTYLVQAKGIIIDGKKMRVLYSLSEGPKDGGDKPHVQLPSKEELEEAEFWTCSYSSVGGFGPFERDDDFTRGLGWYYSQKGNLLTAPAWMGEGLYMKVVGLPGSEALKWLWREKRSKIEMYYPGCPITLEKKSGRPCKITVRVSKEPFRNFLYSTLEEKEEYARWVLCEEERFSDVVERLLEDFNAKKETEFICPDELFEYL
jgi:hypothetical protein